MAKKYDRELLVSKVAMMRIKGQSTHSILDFLMGQLNESRKISYEILKDAQKYIMDQTNEDTRIALADAIQKLELLYEEGNRKERLEVLKELNKLRGLYSPEKIELKGEINHKVTVIRLNGPDGEEKK